MVDRIGTSIKIDSAQANSDISRLASTIKTLEGREDRAAQATKKLTTSIGHLNSFLVGYNNQLKKTSSSAANAGTSQEKLAKQTNSASLAAKKHGRALGAVDYVKFVFGANLAYQAFTQLRLAITDTFSSVVQLDKAMAEVSTLFSDNQSVKVLTKDVLALSDAYGKRATEEAKGLYQVISAGFTDSAESVKVLDQANKLALGGVTDVKTAADGLTSVLNAYNFEASEASHVSDVLFASMRLGKTTIGELSDSIGDVAPIAASTKVSLEELSAAITTLTTGGIQTSTAVQNVRNVLNKVLKGPTAQAAREIERLKRSGALSLDFEFSSTGIEKAGGLRAFIQELSTATGAVSNLQGGVAELSGGNAESLAKLFGNVRAIIPVLALAGSQSEKYTQILNETKDSLGATETAVSKMSNTFSVKYAKAINKARNAFSEGLLPDLQVLADEVFNGQNIELIKSLGLAFGFLAKSVALLTAAVTDLGRAGIKVFDIFIEDVSTAVAKVLGFIDKIPDAIKKNSKALTTYGAVGKGIIDTLNDAGKANKKFADGLDAVTKLQNKKAAGDLIDTTTKDFDALLKSYDNLFGAQNEYRNQLEADIKKQKEADAAKKNLLDTNIKATERLVATLTPIQQIASFMERSLDGVFDEINEGTDTFRDVFTGAFDDAADALTEFVTGGKASFRDFVTSVLKDIARIQIREGLSGILSSVGGAALGAAFGGTTTGGVAGDTSSIINVPSAGKFTQTDLAPIPGFASGGDFNGGLRIVGENGPELEATGRSKIFNTRQTKDIMSGRNNNNAGVQNVFNIQSGVTKQELTAIIPVIEQRTKASLADNVSRGGQYASAFGR